VQEREILRRSYDRSAPGYDEVFRPLQIAKYEAVLARAGPPPGAGRLLDVGSGTGLLGAFLAERFGTPPARLVALDLSPAMLRLGRGRTPFSVEGDAARLPFRDRAFAAVYAFTVLRIIPEDQDFETQALAEIARVLAPGGLFAVSVLARGLDPAFPPFRSALARARLLPGPSIPCGQDVAFVCLRAPDR
jgi:ubiquinone/menaquinone biosynthesis C-methylase UbiE